MKLPNVVDIEEPCTGDPVDTSLSRSLGVWPATVSSVDVPIEQARVQASHGMVKSELTLSRCGVSVHLADAALETFAKASVRECDAAGETLERMRTLIPALFAQPGWQI